MSIFKLEQSRRAITFDFLFYGFSVLVLVILLALNCPSSKWWLAITLSFAGFAISSLVEYFSHRFILHGVKPFSNWHQRHHDQPKAGIGTPTIVSASLIVLLIFIPVGLSLNLFYALAVTLGVVAGYGTYSVTHHATHHWHGHSRWLTRRKYWHGLHHCVRPDRCFGVTSSCWDQLFGTSQEKYVSRPKYE